MGNIWSIRREFGLIIEGAIIFTVSFLWKDWFTDFKNVYFPKETNLFEGAIYTLVVSIALIALILEARGIFGLEPGRRYRFDDSPIGNDNSGDTVGGD